MVRSIGLVAALVASVGMAVPAQAQWRGGYRPYRHHDRIDGGDVLLGAVLAGGVIAVATAASNANRQRQALPAPEPLPQQWDDRDGQHGSFDDGDDFGDDDVPVAPDDEDRAVASTGEDQAADACAAAAEAEGRRLARRAVVSEVTDVDRAGNGWFVAGTIELSDGYRDEGSGRSFRCNLAGGQAPSVRIDGGLFARR